MNQISNNEVGSSVRSKLNTLIALLTAFYKNSDETRKAGGLDYDFAIPVTAGETYLIEYYFVFNQSGIDDAPGYTFDIPAITGNIEHMKIQTWDGGTSAIDYNAAPFLATLVGDSHAGINVFKGWIRLTPSADGFVILSWANGTGAGNSTLKAGSWMKACLADYGQS